MTTLWFAGAENPSHHHLFEYCSVDRVAVNVGSFHRNYSSSWKLGFTVDEWVAWSDAPVSLEQVLECTEAMGKAPTWVILPIQTAHGYEDLDTYLPLWDGSVDFPTPSAVGRGLVVSDRVFTDKALNNRVLSSKRSNNTIGVVTGKSKNLERYDFVITNAWWSAIKHGETQIWDGIKFNRLNATNKTEVRSQYAEHIAALGVNEWDVLADDPDSVAMLAIKSWQAYETFYLDRLGEPEAATPVRSDSDNPGSGQLAVDTRRVRERHVLPTIQAFEEVVTDDDENIVESTLLVASTHDSLRQCNNCFLAPSCPAFEPNHACKYSIPVEIRTKDQLSKVMQAVLEIQTKRVLEARFAEEIQGQELGTEVGREMDRLFKLTGQMRDIMDNRDTLRVTVEGKGSGAGGALSRLFGDRVGSAAKSLDSPVKSDAVIEALEVREGD